MGFIFITEQPFPVMRKGDEVLIRQVAPISKHKAHRLDKILRSPETERDLLVAEQAIAKAEAEAAAAAATTATAA
jgi:small subunit ribosomal protein S17